MAGGEYLGKGCPETVRSGLGSLWWGAKNHWNWNCVTWGVAQAEPRAKRGRTSAQLVKGCPDRVARQWVSERERGGYTYGYFPCLNASNNENTKIRKQTKIKKLALRLRPILQELKKNPNVMRDKNFKKSSFVYEVKFKNKINKIKPNY